MVPEVHILKPDLQDHHIYGPRTCPTPQEVVRTCPDGVQNWSILRSQGLDFRVRVLILTYFDTILRPFLDPIWVVSS